MAEKWFSAGAGAGDDVSCLSDVGDDGWSSDDDADGDGWLAGDDGDDSWWSPVDDAPDDGWSPVDDVDEVNRPLLDANSHQRLLPVHLYDGSCLSFPISDCQIWKIGNERLFLKVEILLRWSDA